MQVQRDSSPAASALLIGDTAKTSRRAPADPADAPASVDSLILDASLRQSLVTVRSLGRRGLRVAALETSARAPAFASRWCCQTYICPGAVGTDAYLDYLAHLLPRVGRRVLIIPSHDGTIELLRRHRAELTPHWAIALADESALSAAIDKTQTLAIARTLGLCVPRGLAAAAIADVGPVLAHVGLPAVAKTTRSWLWRDGRGVRVSPRLVTSRDEACRVVDDVSPLGGVVLFQELLSGRREAVSFLYAGGHVHARFAQWARRTDPPLGGESVLRQSIAVPADIGEQSERLIRAIDLEGYSEVEFRRDAAGVPYLMEINPRLSASVEIAVRCGVDFPYLVYQWASGRPIDPVDGYRTGIWMRYFKGDLMTTIEALRQRGRPGVAPPARAILDFGLSCFRPMAYDYVNWRDLLPAVHATSAFTRAAVKALARGPRGTS